MADPPLPQILAGPILRRTEKTGAWVWLATSQPVKVTATAYEAASTLGSATRKEVGSGTASSLPFGASLHMVLVAMAPAAGSSLPIGTLLAYDLRVDPVGSGKAFQLSALDEFAGGDRIAYPPYSLPTFFLPAPTVVNLLHGSCRKAHGLGDDAMVAVDTVLAANAGDLVSRPSALFLTGDQIYADDVAEVLTKPVRDLGRRLLGFGERAPLYVEQSERVLTNLEPGDRGKLLAKIFTPDSALDVKASTARNHLIGFGEFAAVHLLWWNRSLWGTGTGMADADVRGFRAGLAGVRRALANIPTYMMLDDHEITDDWNRTKAWQARAEASPLGRRVIANGLVAFWAFQAWGNDPAAARPDFATAASDFFAAGSTANPPPGYEKLALGFRDFSFVAPTHPRAVVVDMRTTRGPDAGATVNGKAPDPDAPCEMLGQKGIDAFVALAKPPTCNPGELLVVVAPAPVVGFAPWERVQEYATEIGVVTADRVDLESWHGNPPAYHRFLLAIADQVKPGACLFLSGDVHFGHMAKAVLTGKPEAGKPARHIGFTQFTSSALKHRHGKGKVTALGLATRIVADIGPEWVWRPKAGGGSLPRVRPALQADYASAVATDGVPDYTHRSYGVGATTCAASPLLITDSNLGQVTMADAKPATMARFMFLDAGGKIVVERSMFLDWRWSLRPRQQ